MALVEFKNNSAPYLNAENLNDNFNELIPEFGTTGNWKWVKFKPSKVFIAWLSALELTFNDGQIVVNAPFQIIKNDTNIVGSAVWENIAGGIVNGRTVDETHFAINLFNHDGTAYNGKNMVNITVIGRYV